jgi:UDP-N-acetylmuramate: L-alanyl-gamma-D-glutamyl-meso-diaminopimelate ligase
MGCWTPVAGFAASASGDEHWYAAVDGSGDYSSFRIMAGERQIGEVHWDMVGRHNAQNALAAILAARNAGVEVSKAIEALSLFAGVRRRMEVRGVVNGVTVYDDFAHHPTAVETTIDGLRRRIGNARLLAVLEPRSNTMKLGTHRDALANSLSKADHVWMYQGPGVQWDVAGSVAALGDRASVSKDLDELIAVLARTAKAGDHVLIMSNGGFGGIHAKLLAKLQADSVGK